MVIFEPCQNDQYTWLQGREGERKGGNVSCSKDALHVGLHKLVDDDVAARIQYNVGVSLEKIKQTFKIGANL